jgi:hypothetical protein
VKKEDVLTSVLNSVDFVMSVMISVSILRKMFVGNYQNLLTFAMVAMIGINVFLLKEFIR